MSGCASSPPAPRADDLVGGVGNERSRDQDASLAAVRGMTFDELRACASDWRNVSNSSHLLSQRFAELKDLERTLKSEGESIESSRATVNATSQKSVDAFNGRIEAHRTAIAGLNAGINSYNADANDNKAKVQKFNLNCTNRPYRSTDVDRLSPDLKQVWRERGSESKFNLPVYFTDDENRASGGRSGGGLHIGGSRPRENP
jgi:seryl-tRNA synthetase